MEQQTNKLQIKVQSLSFSCIIDLYLWMRDMDGKCSHAKENTSF